MAEYFVWSTPALVRVIDAIDEQAAAAIFLEEDASPVGAEGEPPACFIQETECMQAPRVDGTTIGFWRAGEG